MKSSSWLLYIAILSCLTQSASAQSEFRTFQTGYVGSYAPAYGTFNYSYYSSAPFRYRSYSSLTPLSYRTGSLARSYSPHYGSLQYGSSLHYGTSIHTVGYHRNSNLWYSPYNNPYYSPWVNYYRPYYTFSPGFFNYQCHNGYAWTGNSLYVRPVAYGWGGPAFTGSYVSYGYGPQYFGGNTGWGWGYNYGYPYGAYGYRGYYSTGYRGPLGNSRWSGWGW